MIIIQLLIAALAVLVSSYILPGITVSSFWIALGVAVVLALLNNLVKPILLFLSLPINILTFGLFTFVINAIIILATARLVDGFRVDGFLWALLFSLIVSAINSLFIEAFTDESVNRKKLI